MYKQLRYETFENFDKGCSIVSTVLNDSKEPTKFQMPTMPNSITLRYKANLNFNAHATHIYSKKTDDHLPKYFNWRDKNVGTVLNQENCGSCWLISTMTAVQDHCTIKSIPVELKQEEIRSRCKLTDICSGGNPAEFLSKCSLSNELSLTNVKIYSDVATIKHEILQKGPLVAGLLVYDNFMSGNFGKHGIYLDSVQDYNEKGEPIFGPLQHLLGAHSIVVVGWGVADNVETSQNHFETVHYWICRNSWGTTWADGGYFKIATHKVNKQVQLEKLYQFRQQEWGGVLSFDVTHKMSKRNENIIICSVVGIFVLLISYVLLRKRGV